MQKKLNKLNHFLNSKKEIYSELEEVKDEKPYTTKLTLWKKSGFHLMVEQFRDDHFYAEDLYDRDEILDFKSLEEVLVFLKKEFNVSLENFHR